MSGTETGIPVLVDGSKVPCCLTVLVGLRVTDGMVGVEIGAWIGGSVDSVGRDGVAGVGATVSLNVVGSGVGKGTCVTVSSTVGLRVESGIVGGGMMGTGADVGVFFGSMEGKVNVGDNVSGTMVVGLEVTFLAVGMGVGAVVGRGVSGGTGAVVVGGNVGGGVGCAVVGSKVVGVGDIVSTGVGSGVGSAVDGVGVGTGVGDLVV